MDLQEYELAVPHLGGQGWGGLRCRGEGEAPLVSTLYHQLTGLLLQVAHWPGLCDGVQVTSQAAAPLVGHSASHEGNTGFLHTNRRSSLQPVQLQQGNCNANRAAVCDCAAAEMIVKHMCKAVQNKSTSLKLNRMLTECCRTRYSMSELHSSLLMTWRNSPDSSSAVPQTPARRCHAAS